MSRRGLLSLEGATRSQGEDGGGEEGQEQDPFEEEMRRELMRRARKAEDDGGLQHRGRRHDDVDEPLSPQSPGPSSSSAGANAAKDGRQKYDDVYFDSDEEGQGCAEGRRAVPSNDDLLYDPDEDDDNQRYVDELRAGYAGKRKRKKKRGDQSEEKLPNSDAVLSCPACFVTLCRDCQRHQLYDNQYRAMFVMNCRVVEAERLKFPLTKSGRKAGGGKRGGGGTFKSSAAPDGEETYHPVRCEQCDTEVAVFDKDEVYHFFNVMTGY